MENTESILSDIQPKHVEALYIDRFPSIFIDFVMEIALLALVYFSFRESISFLLKSYSFAIYIMIFLVIFIYRTACLFLFEKTIGMMLSNLKYLNRSAQQLSTPEKLIAALFNRTSSIKIYRQI